jgi:hypothetical protein
MGIAAVRLDPDGTGAFTFVPGSMSDEAHVAAGTTQELTFAPGGWREDVDMLQDTEQRLVTSAYGDGDTFVGIVRYLETPYVVTLRCRVDGDALQIDLRFNVSFWPPEMTLRSR